MTFQKNKNIFIAALLALVMVPVFIAAFFLIQQTIIRHEMKEQLEQQSLQTIRIPEKNVSWVEKEKELFVDGKLFDVKSLKNENGYTVVTGLFDDMELYLQQRLISLHNPEKNGKQKQEFIYRILIQQLAEKTKLPSWEIGFFNAAFTFNAIFPDIMLRDPHLFLPPKPPDTFS